MRCANFTFAECLESYPTGQPGAATVFRMYPWSPTRAIMLTNCAAKEHLAIVFDTLCVWMPYPTTSKWNSAGESVKPYHRNLCILESCNHVLVKQINEGHCKYIDVLFGFKISTLPKNVKSVWPSAETHGLATHARYISYRNAAFQDLHWAVSRNNASRQC